MLQEMERNQVRVKHNWQSLYVVLIKLMKQSLVKVEMRGLLDELIMIFDIIITHGDAFLLDSTAYDYCYYEIVRNHELFKQVINSTRLALNVKKISYIVKASIYLENMMAICDHFLAKILKTESVTMERVMEILRQNYDTLELRVGHRIPDFKKTDANVQKVEILIMRSLIKEIMCVAKRDWLYVRGHLDK